MKLSDNTKTALKWVGGTLGTLLFTAVVTMLFTPWGEDIERWFRSWTNPDLYSETIATDVPACVTGFVPRLLAPAGGESPADLSNGARRTYICDNASIEANKNDFAEKLADTYPGCFTFTRMIKPDLALNQDSTAVCRALYQVVNGRAEPSTYELGVNICLGGKASQYNRIYDPNQTQFPRPCSDAELRAQGFL